MSLTISEKYSIAAGKAITAKYQGGLIVLLTFLAYLPSLTGSFVWDDDAWTTGLAPVLSSPAGLWLIWANPAVLQQYYPLTGTTFWLDFQIWGFWPPAYHVENVLLHSAAALLFWRLLIQFGIRGAWLAAAIFALHPVMVESVAWVTERKNVLSLVFYLGALLAYGRYAGWSANLEVQDVEPVDRQRFCDLSFFLFLAALLSKTSTFSLPAVILLVGWWRNGTIRWREDLLPCLRFFILSLVFCAVTFWLEKYRLGASGSEFDYSFAERCVLAGQTFWFYVVKLLWPANLCFVYPRWHPDPALFSQWLYPSAAAGLLLCLWLARRRIGRGPAAAVFFYAGTLFPVMGFLNAYGMRYSLVWDHWVYLPSLGIITLLAAGLINTAEFFLKSKPVQIVSLLLLPVLGLLTWRHAGMFSDMQTLWCRTLAANPDCALANNNYGTLLYSQGQREDAKARYRKAIKAKPDYHEAIFNLGLCLAYEGRFEEAIPYYRKAIQLYPTFPDALNSLGFALANQSRHAEAVNEYREAVRLNPGFLAARFNLGNALLYSGQLDEAVAQFNELLRLKPDANEVRFSLARAMNWKDRIESCASNPAALNNLAWELATSPETRSRNGSLAVKLAEAACQQTQYQQPIMVGTLAAAHAEAGHFDAAVSTAQKACALAAQAGDNELLKRNQELAVRYQNRQPYHEPAIKPDDIPAP